MPGADSQSAGEELNDRVRQYTLDQLADHIVSSVRLPLHLQNFALQHTDTLDVLVEFLVYYHLVASALPPVSPSERSSDLSIAARATLFRIHEARFDAGVVGFTSLVERGASLGYAPVMLASVVGLSLDILAKLEAGAIRRTSIPATLLQRLAAVLHVEAGAIDAYLDGRGPWQAHGLYASGGPPVTQETFADAVRQSTMLLPQWRRDWEEVVGREHI